MRRSLPIIVLAALAGGAWLALAAEPVALKTTEFGRGPTVVLVHSMGSTRSIWMPTARKLLAGHRVVMVDLPGHGESALPDPFSFDACAEALAQVVARQNPDSTVLVGQGVGGYVALLAARAHPERVRGLVLIDASVRAPFPVPDQQQRRFFQMLDQRYDDFVKPLFTRMGRDSVQGQEIYAQAVQTPPATIKAYIRALFSADATGALKELKVPVLVVGSGHRWPAGRPWAEQAVEMGYAEAPAVTARRVDDCGALIMKEQPDSLAAILGEFAATTVRKR